MRLRSLSALGAFAVLAALLTVSAASGASSASKKTYIVQMLDAPAVAYEGGTAGIPATKPGKGQKLDPASGAVKQYLGHLKAKHDRALEKVGGAQKVYDYGVSFNGFAAELTAAQAEGLEKVEGVVAVSPDQIRQPDTSNTPTFLGINQPGGLWSKLGGVGTSGEDIIIGVVDTGVWPEHLSFSDRHGIDRTGKPDGDMKYPHKARGYTGTCDAGEGFTGSECNRKLVGAQYFYEGFGLEQIAERDFLSPRDYNGHGSHTASTAGGNSGIQATGDAANFGKITGMAPRARIAAYKVCWEDAGDGGCSDADSVAAIDKAVADGVDVINFSISGSRTNFLDSVEVAFLFAAEAGVFVATSAGNTNGTSTVAHPSPWVTTVAASTHGLGGTGEITLGNGAKFTGNSLTRAVPSKPLIRSSAAGRAGADANAVRLCFNDDVLDPAKVTGKIIICDRGGNVLVDKAAAAKAAGAAGMILANTTTPPSANTTFGILHVVPTIHVVAAVGDAIKAYLDANPAAATASFADAVITYNNPAPRMADFSSDGPLLAGGGDILKPDVSAPGVDVLAAVAPPGNHDRLFDLISGTSMSSPHVAGLGAALKQLHPTWSPMMIKSALMTTGYDVPATTFGIFEFGGGHVRPNNAMDPGLVFDSNFSDWLMFLQGQNCGCLPASFPKIDASDLNQASIAIGDMAGSQTVKRAAKSVGSQSETYTFSVSGLTGITATPSVPAFTAAPGSTTPFSVTFQRTTAPLDAYAQGFITWTGNRGHVVRMPVVIKPVAIAAPAEVSGTGGAMTWTAKSGSDGTLNATVRGLAPATTTTFTLAQDPDATFDPADSTGTFKKDITVPANSVFRAGIYEDAIKPSGTDLDFYVYVGSTQVASSADGDSNEEVTLRNSGGAVTVTVYVHGWSTAGPSAEVTLFDWAATTDAGNFAVSPATEPVTTGEVVTYSATPSGLASATRYFGVVEYDNGSSRIGETYVSIKTP
jgi:Subtilase family/Fibronectin type-III domain/PA domain/Peptidase inhibitor I9